MILRTASVLSTVGRSARLQASLFLTSSTCSSKRTDPDVFAAIKQADNRKPIEAFSNIGLH